MKQGHHCNRVEPELRRMHLTLDRHARQPLVAPRTHARQKEQYYARNARCALQGLNVPQYENRLDKNAVPLPRGLRSGANITWSVVSAVFAIGTFAMLFDPTHREDLGLAPLVISTALFALVAVWNLRASRRKARARDGFLKQSQPPAQLSRNDPGRKPLSAAPVPTVVPARPPVAEALPESLPIAPGSSLDAPRIPTYEGKPIYEVLDEVAFLKRNGDLDEALNKAQGAMLAMAQPAVEGGGDVMETYVIQVAIILHKMGRYEEEARTIQEWLDLGLPAPRPDHRVDLQKRLAKANEQWAKSEGRNFSVHTAEWRRLIEVHKAAKEQYRTGGVAISASGKSKVEGARSYGSKEPRSSSTSRRQGGPLLPVDGHVAQEFVAVDFETANRERRSACAVAMVRMINGQAVGRYTTLLRPPDDLAYFEFTRIHGIVAGDVAKAPQWRDVQNEVLEFVAGSPVWAHNARFDRSVWRALDQQFGTRSSPTDFFCSMELAMRTFDALPNYKLPTVVQAVAPHFRLSHHDAASDAEACGLIVARAASIWAA